MRGIDQYRKPLPVTETDRTASPPWTRLAPLVLAAGASQALLVVLSTTIVAIGDELRAPVGAVAQARSITAGVAIVASVALTTRTDTVGVPRLLRFGAALAIVACAGVAASSTLAVFLAAHVLVGLAFACLLSAGFTGVAAFAPDRRAWAMGYVTAANAAAWIIVNPVVGVVTGRVSWRVAEAVPAVIAAAALPAARSAVPVPARRGTLPIRALLADVPARRWIGAELTAYGAWTAFLTFSGAFFIDVLGVRETAAGWLLICAPATHLLASVHSGRLVGMVSRRRLVAGTALSMAVLLPALLTVARSVPGAAGICCLIGLASGVRTPASGGLGLEQLPGHPGAMMTARTAATQAGYLMGAVLGGALIAGGGYGALGLMLAAGMAASALLVLRVKPAPAVNGRLAQRAQ